MLTRIIQIIFYMEAGASLYVVIKNYLNMIWKKCIILFVRKYILEIIL